MLTGIFFFDPQICIFLLSGFNFIQYVTAQNYLVAYCHINTRTAETTSIVSLSSSQFLAHNEKFALWTVEDYLYGDPTFK